jgi:hypothetical protein
MQNVLTQSSQTAVQLSSCSKVGMGATNVLSKASWISVYTHKEVLEYLRVASM